MKKIPTMFMRSEDRRSVVDEVTPGCEWVLAGEGRATRKWDGICVVIEPGEVYVRREVKPGGERPEGFVELEFDETTGKTVGLEPAEQSGFWKFVIEAIGLDPWPKGSYELCGPKINGNPEQMPRHVLLRHGDDHISTDDDPPRDFAGLRDYLLVRAPMEGIVFHHPDGRMAKIKWRDFR